MPRTIHGIPILSRLPAPSLESSLRAEIDRLTAELDTALDRCDTLESQLEEERLVSEAMATYARRQQWSGAFDCLSVTIVGTSAADVDAGLTDALRLVDWMSERDASRRVPPALPVFDLSDTEAA